VNCDVCKGTGRMESLDARATSGPGCREAATVPCRYCMERAATQWRTLSPEERTAHLLKRWDGVLRRLGDE
jgi:hypothetical protein